MASINGISLKAIKSFEGEQHYEYKYTRKAGNLDGHRD